MADIDSFAKNLRMDIADAKFDAQQLEGLWAFADRQERHFLCEQLQDIAYFVEQGELILWQMGQARV